MKYQIIPELRDIGIYVNLQLKCENNLTPNLKSLGFFIYICFKI